MADRDEQDWRVTEGPVFGVEPEFELSSIRLGANFIETRALIRRITSVVTAFAPMIVESLGRTLPELSGCLRIFDIQPTHTLPGFGKGVPVELGAARGALWLGATTDL